MKLPKFLLTACAIAVTLTAFSQESQVRKDSAVHRWGIYPPPPVQTETVATNTHQDSSSIVSFPAPNFGNYYIPVLGSYTSEQNNSGKNIVITGDEKNIGKVWIEGLTSTKVYALLKATPGTYKIPAQNQVQEGTLIYDDQSKEVNICVGCGYQDQNPTTLATTQKSKKKSNKYILNYSGVKTDQGTVSTR